MNPRELSAHFLLQSRCLLGLAVLLFLVSTPPQLGKAWKAIASLSAGVALGAAWGQRCQHKRYEPMGGVYSQHELATYAKFLQTTTELGTAAVSGMWETVQTQAQVIPPTPEIPLLPAQTFDWNRFNTEPDTYAHLAIVGPTGSGKSTLAECLATQLGGVTLAIAPHRKPGDFKALGNRVYCGGRNYGGGKDTLADWKALLQGTAGKVSVVAVIKAVFEEMDRRYQLLDAGQDVGQFTNIIWDETLAALDEAGKTLVPLMLKLLREARRVRLRLILLPQDDAVKSLHLEGQGAARANLSYVRLGKIAIAHAKSLEKSEPGVLTQVQSQRRPCLVEDIPAIIPEYNPAIAIPPRRKADPMVTTEAQNSIDLTVNGEEETKELLNKIQEFGQGKTSVTGSDLKRNINTFKSLPVSRINVLLERLVAHGIGDLDDSSKALKWLPPSTGTNGTKSQ